VATKKLTKAELRLLEYPPTESTWRCQAPKPTADNENAVCGMVNSGSLANCWVCMSVEPRSLLWPEYQKAAAKAGVPDESLGKRWTPEVANVPVKRQRRTRRKSAS
jgi:hypothetical protein